MMFFKLEFFSKIFVRYFTIKVSTNWWNLFYNAKQYWKTTPSMNIIPLQPLGLVFTTLLVSQSKQFHVFLMNMWWNLIPVLFYLKKSSKAATLIDSKNEVHFIPLFSSTLFITDIARCSSESSLCFTSVSEYQAIDFGGLQRATLIICICIFSY